MIRNKTRNKPSRIGKYLSTEVEVENAKVERRNRVIDLSKYNVGFEQVVDKETRPPNPCPTKGQYYEKYLAKYEKGNLSKFSSRDIMYFFKDTAEANGVKYVVSNMKRDMRTYNLAKEKGYTVEEILAMIEFLFTSGQKYLDIRTLNPSILISGWCNKIYQDTMLWLDDKYDPNVTTPKSNYTQSREWKDNNDEVKSSIGEWD